MALISTLTDNFNDNSIDGAKWASFAYGGSSIAETNNEIEMTSTTSGANCGIDSVTTYDLTGSQASIKIVDAGNQALASMDFYVLFLYDGGNYIYWEILAGTIKATYRPDGGGYTSPYSTTYVAATHRYLRIRESGGTVYWDYSADGISWTNAASVSNPFAVTALIVEINLSLGAEASTTTAKIDDFNILPGFLTGVTFLS